MPPGTSVPVPVSTPAPRTSATRSSRSGTPTSSTSRTPPRTASPPACRSARSSCRALAQAPVALIKNDNYLAQDMLVRRTGQILAEHGSKVTYGNLLVSATHDHNSPYYSTPAAGVWLFQDVDGPADVRVPGARHRAGRRDRREVDAAGQAGRDHRAVPLLPRQHRRLRRSPRTGRRPATRSSSTTTASRSSGSTTCAASRSRPTSTTRQHGESMETTDLITADWLAPFQRFVDRATGAPVVFSQGSVGLRRGSLRARLPGRRGRRSCATTASRSGEIWAHVDFAQTERGAHLLSDKVARGVEADRRATRARRRWTATRS